MISSGYIHDLIMNLFQAMDALAEGVEGVTCRLIKEMYGSRARLVLDEDGDTVIVHGADPGKKEPVLRVSLFKQVDWRVAKPETLS